MGDKYIEYNLGVKKSIEKEYGKPLVVVAGDQISGYYFAKTFQCIKCGKFLPTPVLRFYNWNVEKTKCYECQGLPKRSAYFENIHGKK